MPLSAEKSGKVLRLLKYAGYFMVLALTAMALYQVFFMVRLTAGITSEKPAPEQLVTVEIVNASGLAQNSALVKGKLENIRQEDFEILVVKMERLEYKNIGRSLVISRSADTRPAEFVARSMGLNESEIVYRPSLENDMSPSVTLVLGEDIQQVLNPEKPTKES